MSDVRWGGSDLPEIVAQHLCIGVVVRPPQYGWDGERFTSDQLVRIDRTAVAESAEVVVEENFVGVVAANLSLAQEAAQALRIEWQGVSEASAPKLKAQSLACAGAGKQLAKDGELDSSYYQEYGWPSRMRWGEVAGWVIAEYTAEHLRVWGETVTPDALAHDLEIVTGLKVSQITLYGVHPSPVSGLGRHCGDDAAVDAVLMSRALGRPVAVWLDSTYNRDRHALGQAQHINQRTTLNEVGRVVRYRYRQASAVRDVPAVGAWLSGALVEYDKTEGTSESIELGSPYAFGDEQHMARVDRAVPGFDNATLAEVQQTFARESFLDEVAHTSEQDPVALRLRHLDDQRGIELIKSVTRRAQWGETLPNAKASPIDQLFGRGFAYAQLRDCHQRVVSGIRSAWVADVVVNRITGEIQLTRLVVGQDSGSEVDTGRLQEMLQARVLGKSQPLLGREPDFDEWGDGSEVPAGELVRRQEMPAERGATASALAVAPPEDIDLSPGVAVIANALFDATGVRFRQPPFTASRVRAAISKQKRDLELGGGRQRSRWWGLTSALVAVASTAAMAWPWKGAIAPIARPAVNLYSAETIERGRLVAAAGDCVACHTVEGGIENAGGHAFKTPFGTVYSTNLTPDETTGIGQWSFAAFERAMRHGISRDGKHLYPAFPYTAFAKISDTDMQALYAYLMSRPAVNAVVPENSLSFPFNISQLMAGWNVLNHDSKPFIPDPMQSELYNRGAYLAEGLGHCSACHSPRNAMGAEQQGEYYLAGAMVDGWEAPPLNHLSRSPIPWSESSLYDYLRKGSSALHGIASGPMAPVSAGLSELPEYDVRAIAHYVAEQMGAPAVDSEAVQAEAAQRIAQSQTSPAELEAGERLFDGACAACHVDSGLPSLSRASTSLALNTNLHSEHSDNVIQSILGGVHAEYVPGIGNMPGFSDSFSNSQVATLTSYLQARFAPDRPPWQDVESRVAAIRGESTIKNNFSSTPP